MLQQIESLPAHDVVGGPQHMLHLPLSACSLSIKTALLAADI